MAKSCRTDFLLVSPYITNWGLQRLLDAIPPQVRLTVLTDLSPSVLLQASEPEAFRQLIATPQLAALRHLEGLHAKVYVADRERAIVTSGNLTRGGLALNHEVGLHLSNALDVASLVDSLQTYLGKSSRVDCTLLAKYLEAANAHRKSQTKPRKPPVELGKLLGESVKPQSFRGLRKLFLPTILSTLAQRGSMSLQEIYETVRSTHPRESNDAVLRGRNEQILWRHEVRFALNGAKLEGKVKKIPSGNRIYWTLA